MTQQKIQIHFEEIDIYFFHLQIIYRKVSIIAPLIFFINLL